MLPRLVEGADESLRDGFLSLNAEFQDQLPKVSDPWLVPFANGGGGVVGLELIEGACELADCKEKLESDSRIL